ncbi:hypothetical protein ACIA8C_22860 [Nocardia sp. NPDC051321]|uniref:phosphotransferase-like protein n=1 Tax=Nocardia sp. NPDC051321 TaxID=3364323 RepID=UPI0037A7B1E7
MADLALERAVSSPRRAVMSWSRRDQWLSSLGHGDLEPVDHCTIEGAPFAVEITNPVDDHRNMGAADFTGMANLLLSTIVIRVNTDDRPICIVVNGPSAVGKSTLVSQLQTKSPVPLLRFGIDQLYGMVPPPWAGGTPNARNSREGFSYVSVQLDDKTSGRVIRNGVDAVRMLRAMNAAIISILMSGMNVVVDGQPYERHITDEFYHCVQQHVSAGHIEATFVELTASRDALLERQSRHAHPADLSIAQHQAGLISPNPDFVLDTARLSSEEVLAAVWDRLAERHRALATG